MSLLTSADYPSIRAALRADLAAADLSDAILGSDLYLPAAEAEVLKLDPLALTRTGDELARVRRAAVFIAAALLAWTVPVMTSFTEADVTEAYVAWDPEKRAAALRAMAMRELSALGVANPAAVHSTYCPISTCPLW